MKYRHSHERSDNRFWYVTSTIIVVGVLVAFFVYGVKEFREPEEPEPSPLVGSIADVLKPSPLLLSAEEQKKITGREKAVLRPVGSDEAIGRALREVHDGVFSLDISATLPEIDREKLYYEVWLLQRVPFEFFSAGEMVTNDLGDFVLSFEGDPRGAYAGFTQVIITQERYGGPPDPGDHVAEGEFY